MNIFQIIYTPKIINKQRDLIINLDSTHIHDCEWRDSMLIVLMCEQDIATYKELNKIINNKCINK